MSEGSAVGYVSRWAMNDAETGILQVAAGLSGVRCSYRPLEVTDFVGDNGRIEAIYWGNLNTDVEVRALKGTANIKYSEEGERDLVIFVAAENQGDSGADVEERAFNLLGEVVLALQANQPTSPGSHLTNIRAFVDDWDGDVGTLSRGGVKVHAITLTVSIRIQANVEQ